MFNLFQKKTNLIFSSSSPSVLAASNVGFVFLTLYHPSVISSPVLTNYTFFSLSMEYLQPFCSLSHCISPFDAVPTFFSPLHVNTKPTVTNYRHNTTVTSTSQRLCRSLHTPNTAARPATSKVDEALSESVTTTLRSR